MEKNPWKRMAEVVKHGEIWEHKICILKTFAKLHLVNLLNTGGSIEYLAFKLQRH